MNTDQKYEKLTITIPRVILARLKMIPKGDRSSFIAKAIQESVQIRGLKSMAKRISQKKGVSKIQERAGRWRKRLSW